tara:strand:- start:43769 stop:46123 length:2355 start_codon:yes stop_codon:yes gene_type:complete
VKTYHNILLHLILTISITGFVSFNSNAQKDIDSLQNVLVNHLDKGGYSNDTTVVNTYYRIARKLRSDRDTSNFYYDLAINFCDDAINGKRYDEVKTDYFRYIKGLSLTRKGKSIYRDNEYDKAEKIGKEAVKVLKKLELSENEKARTKGLDYLTFTTVWLAVLHQKQGNTEKALAYYDETERYTYITKDTTRRSLIWGNIAVLHKNNGNLKEALEYNFKALELAEQVKSPARIATVVGNIGVVYKHLKEYDKATSYYNRAINIYEQLGNSKGLARMYNNLGIISRHREQYEDALKYYEQSLQIAEDLKMKGSIVSAKINMAVILKHQDKLDQAELLLLEALELAKETKYKKNIININSTLAELYIRQDKIKQAEPYLKTTLEYAEEMDSDRFRENAHQNYYLYHKALNNHEKALSHYQKYIKYRDEVYNLESKEAALEQEMKFEYRTKKIADSIAFAKQNELNELMIKQQESELQTQRTLQIALVVILVLILVFAIFMFNRFRVTHRQKNTIERQKRVVDEKNREISDSINYAKRIQEAILPSRYIFNEVMSNGFVVFKPKDVVSGDFYWIEESHGMMYIAAADCTGHGVPGALVSVICSSALSKVLLEEQVEDPAEILNRTREIIIDKFKRSSDRVNDGMDISLCAIDSKNMKVHWAGANSPLWLIRPEPDGSYQLHETKADKQPIGVYQKQHPFTSHTMTIQRGDTLYMFSDGFADQFGGNSEEARLQGGKKYKSKPFKKFLTSIQDTPIKLQQEKIEKEFYYWKGDLDQIDDVCIIGIRIN